VKRLFARSVLNLSAPRTSLFVGKYSLEGGLRSIVLGVSTGFGFYNAHDKSFKNKFLKEYRVQQQLAVRS